MPSPLAAQRLVSVYNAGAQEVPAFGLVRVTDIYSNGVFEVQRPNTAGQLVIVNGPIPIPSEGYGVCSLEDVAIIAYDQDADGTAVNSERWGAEQGTFLARRGKRGWLVYDDLGDGRLLARRAVKPSRFKLTGGGVSVAGGASATVSWGDAVIDTAGLWDGSDPEVLDFTDVPNLYLLFGSAQVSPDSSDWGQVGISLQNTISLGLLNLGFWLSPPASPYASEFLFAKYTSPTELSTTFSVLVAASALGCGFTVANLILEGIEVFS